MMTSPPLSKTRRAGDFLFVSGQLPRNADGAIVAGDIKAQAHQAIANLEAALASEGAGLSDVVKVTAWITDAAHLTGFNDVYASLFPTPYPTRSTVICGLVAGDVEIEAIAWLPQ